MDAIQECIDFARRKGLSKPQDKQLTADKAAAELKVLRDELTMRTLENIKGSSVLDDKNVEIARLKEQLAEAIRYQDERED